MCKNELGIFLTADALERVSDKELLDFFNSFSPKMQDWLLQRAEGKPLGEVLSTEEDLFEYFGLNPDSVQG